MILRIDELPEKAITIEQISKSSNGVHSNISVETKDKEYIFYTTWDAFTVISQYSFLNKNSYSLPKEYTNYIDSKYISAYKKLITYNHFIFESDYLQSKQISWNKNSELYKQQRKKSLKNEAFNIREENVQINGYIKDNQTIYFIANSIPYRKTDDGYPEFAFIDLFAYNSKNKSYSKIATIAQSNHDWKLERYWLNRARIVGFDKSNNLIRYEITDWSVNETYSLNLKTKIQKKVKEEILIGVE